MSLPKLSALRLSELHVLRQNFNKIGLGLNSGGIGTLFFRQPLTLEWVRDMTVTFGTFDITGKINESYFQNIKHT